VILYALQTNPIVFKLELLLTDFIWSSKPICKRANPIFLGEKCLKIEFCPIQNFHFVKIKKI
jgi:hypothetical protein